MPKKEQSGLTGSQKVEENIFEGQSFRKLALRRSLWQSRMELETCMLLSQKSQRGLPHKEAKTIRDALTPMRDVTGKTYPAYTVEWALSLGLNQEENASRDLCFNTGNRKTVFVDA